MWLLDTETLELRFFATPPPRYAILSHTWGSDEVLFDDLRDINQAQNKAGWVKIKFVCEEAKRNQLPYAWVDSCCIDKSKSAELSEAIASMFEWYKQAECCYTYLSDFGEAGEESCRTIKERLAACRWFTRGWTLQELIASPVMVFFGRDWTVIGTKDSLTPELAEITGIDEKVLELMDCMFGMPVARRMSWAAKRQTTRPEDVAYCLLGIFNVNMPLLYGEGGRAFLRLQEEILTQHHDISLFSWCQQEESHSAYRGMFAHSPDEFVGCSSMVSRTSPFLLGARFTVTSQGLMVDLGRHLDYPHPDMTFVDLDCFDTSQQPLPKRIRVVLKKFGDFYVRHKPWTLMVTGVPWVGDSLDLNHQRESKSRTIYIKKTLPPSHSTFIELMSQRRLVLAYRSNLAKSVGKFSPRVDSPLSYDIKSLYRLNNIDESSLGFIQEFNIHFGGDEPIWWDSFTLSPGDEVEYSFAIICGIPINPDAASEQLLPWFGLFCDRDEDARTSHLATTLTGCSRADASRARTRHINETIFQLYTDNSGNVVQQRLPVSFVFGAKDRAGGLQRLSVNRLGGGGSLFCADVQCEQIV